MKKMIRKFKLLLPLLFVLPATLVAQNDNENQNNKKKFEFVKTKSVNKSYSVSTSDELNIDNSFGAVTVQTWNRNEIKVDVSVEVSANSNDLAQKLLDKISIKDDRKGKEISFKTKIDNVNNSKGNKSSMTINYSISMPAGNPLTVKNDFGPTTIPDFKGEVNLTSKFGTLTTGNLTSVKKIYVEFGSATLAGINSAPVTVKFSKLAIGRLSGAVKLNLEFCSSVKLEIDNSLSSLDIKTSYSTVNIQPSGDLSASYTIATSFGSFKNTSSVKFNSDEDEGGNKGPKFDIEYIGKSGSGNIPVKVKSSFGKIIVGVASDADMKDKSKNKTKVSA